MIRKPLTEYRFSLRARATSWYVGLLAMALVVFSIGIYVCIRTYLNESLQRALSGTAHTIANDFLAKLPMKGDAWVLGEIRESYEASPNDHYIRLSAGNEVLYQTGDMRDPSIPIAEIALPQSSGGDDFHRQTIQGRGVMIDLEHHCGRGESFVGYDQLMRIMEEDKVEVEEGDLVCFRTGYDRVILDMNKHPDPKVLEEYPCAALDGRDERILNWITKSGAVALISDNRAVEASPSRPCEEDHCASLPLHAHCLFKLGVYLGEIWYLSELADWLRAQGRSRFLLTAPPLRLPGAVGSPANAIATV